MRGLRAMLGKDLRLFRSGSGLICLLLPLVLLLALRAGAGSLLRQPYLEPFPVAVRDEDRTVMSRSLITQLEQVELFSQVVRAEGETDAELLEQGCAAVVTIPKDFFYTLYRMEQDVVEVSLNRGMPLEASLLRAVFSSVMEIVEADQAAGRAVFRFCYGDLSPERQRELREETSGLLLLDALGRQTVFDGAAEAAQAQDSLERSLLACALSVLCLFFPLSAVRTLPEELASGILPRFRAAGGKLWAFYLSKLLTAWLVALPSLGLLLVLEPQGWAMTLLLTALLFCGGFGLLLLAAAWAGEVSGAQRLGDLILLLSLVLGGSLYAPELMPGFARALGRLTLPWYARRGLELIGAGGGVVELLVLVWPVPAAGLGLTVLSAWVLGRRRPIGGRSMETAAPGPEPGAVPVCGGPIRLLGATGWKLKAMSGGLSGTAGLLAAVTLCGVLAASALNSGGPESLRLAAALEEPSPMGEELLDRVAAMEGVSLERVGPREGERLLRHGAVEGLLLIGSDYDRALELGTELPLHYTGAGPAVTVRAAREIVAGQVVAQKARQWGLREAAQRLGRALEPSEEAALLAEMDRQAAEAEKLYRIGELGRADAVPADPFAPSQLGFAALAVMLTLLTWGAWTARPDSRRVSLRLGSLPGGGLLSGGSDSLALLTVGLLTGLCALLPGGVPTARSLGALTAYVVCVAGLSLWLCRLGGLSGRVDGLAPFLALIGCLAGGCFGDLGQIAPGLRTVSLFTPQGLALAAARGETGAFVLLLCVGVLLLLPGRRPAGR